MARYRTQSEVESSPLMDRLTEKDREVLSLLRKHGVIRMYNTTFNKPNETDVWIKGYEVLMTDHDRTSLIMYRIASTPSEALRMLLGDIKEQLWRWCKRR